MDVWSPDLGARLPVMVYVYGGAYRSGDAADSVYDGATLAGEGVVVVTFTYRVGAEGFAQLVGAPADRGLLDQVAALEWVRDNVAPGSRLTRLFDAEPAVVPYPEETSRRLWAAHTFGALPLLGAH
ncbi:carboxylesterase family protein [Nonomuraea sp. NPDC004580]|uniref:carboxylesterase family protein n=1 Tax=Nonomuraea sp. NPDC004580 TaxID=3154552 RepID=UPI0033AD6C60